MLQRNPVRGICILFMTLALGGAFVHAEPPEFPQGLRALMQGKQYNDAVALLEPYLAANRFDGAAWSNYAYALHMSEPPQFERSIDAGKKAIDLGFRPAVEMYDIACAYARLNKADDAIAWLKKSLDAGFTDQETLEADDELDPLRKDPRFIALTGLNPPADLPARERWVWDLDFLRRRMQQMHWSLYAKVSKETFSTEIEALKKAAPDIGLERAKVRLARILAMVGDGHTTLAGFATDEKELARLPIHLHIFKDGLYIIGAPERSPQAELIGARVLKIGTLSADEAMTRTRPFCSVDNDQGYLYRVPARLAQPALLQEIGAASDDDSDWTVQVEGAKPRTVHLTPQPIAKETLTNSPFSRSGYTYANARSAQPPPLYLRDTETPLTIERLDADRAVYFGFHAVAENHGERFQEFVTRLFRTIDESSADRLIIDIRLNGGGNTGLVMPLIKGLIRNDRVNKPGHLFVIIGRDTFSAAQNTVNLLESMTEATFVGEPTGSRPQFVGESTYILLPYSKLRVHCSSRYWQVLSSTDHRTWVQPQIAAELTFADFAANRDPCMEAILGRLRATPAAAEAGKSATEKVGQ